MNNRKENIEKVLAERPILSHWLLGLKRYAYEDLTIPEYGSRRALTSDDLNYKSIGKDIISIASDEEYLNVICGWDLARAEWAEILTENADLFSKHYNNGSLSVDEMKTVVCKEETSSEIFKALTAVMADEGNNLELLVNKPYSDIEHRLVLGIDQDTVEWAIEQPQSEYDTNASHIAYFITLNDDDRNEDIDWFLISEGILTDKTLRVVGLTNSEVSPIELKAELKEAISKYETLEEANQAVFPLIRNAWVNGWFEDLCGKMALTREALEISRNQGIAI